MERVQPATFLFATLSLAGLLSSCGQPPTAPTSSLPSTPFLAPQPRPPGPTLTGVVFQNTEEGKRPIPGARVFVVDLVDGPYGNYPWYEVASDINGRFKLVAFPHRALKITAYTGTGFGTWNQSGLFQVSAVHPTVDADTTVEIELVQRGVLPQAIESPALSGVVFESTAEGRRPAADMGVLYSSNSHDGADVYGRTDAEGRYRFYNIPVGAGYLLPACTKATMPPPNYHPITFAVDVRGDTVLEANCP